MFEDVDVVLFCVSLIDYDEFSEDKNGVLINKMIASRQLFERKATHPTFEEKKFLLILNKFDLLEEKIEQVQSFIGTSCLPIYCSKVQEIVQRSH